MATRLREWLEQTEQLKSSQNRENRTKLCVVRVLQMVTHVTCELVGAAVEILQRDACRERRELTWTDMRNKDISKIKIESEPKRNKEDIIYNKIKDRK